MLLNYYKNCEIEGRFYFRHIYNDSIISRYLNISIFLYPIYRYIQRPKHPKHFDHNLKFYRKFKPEQIAPHKNESKIVSLRTVRK